MDDSEESFSYPQPEDDHGRDSKTDEQTHDYSTRMKELFADEEEHAEEQHDSDNEEGFFYAGADANVSVGYRDRLRDVLGADHEDEDDTEAHEVERSLIIEDSAEHRSDDDEPLVRLLEYSLVRTK